MTGTPWPLRERIAALLGLARPVTDDEAFTAVEKLVAPPGPHDADPCELRNAHILTVETGTCVDCGHRPGPDDEVMPYRELVP